MDKATPSPASVDSVMALADAYSLEAHRDGWKRDNGRSLNHRTAESRLRAEVERLAAQAAQPEEMSPEFTDTARAALLWVLWHHQGGSSKVGQPIRFALGMGQHDRLSEHQVREAQRWEALAAQPSQAPVMRPERSEFSTLITNECHEIAGLPALPEKITWTQLNRFAEAVWNKCAMQPAQAKPEATYSAADVADAHANGYALGLRQVDRVAPNAQTQPAAAQEDDLWAGDDMMGSSS